MKNKKNSRTTKKLAAQAKAEKRKLLKTVKNLKGRMVKVEKRIITLTKSAKAAKKKAQRKEARIIKSLKKVKAVSLKKQGKLTKQLKAKVQKVKQMKLQLMDDGKSEAKAIATNAGPTSDGNVSIDEVENSTANAIET